VGAPRKWFTLGLGQFMADILSGTFWTVWQPRHTPSAKVFWTTRSKKLPVKVTGSKRPAAERRTLTTSATICAVPSGREQCGMMKGLRLRPPKGCRVPGCERRHYAKDLCKKHYAQVLRHGRLTPEREVGPRRVCLAEGCGRVDTVKGHCRKHHRQIQIHGRLTPERERPTEFGRGAARRGPAR
jgi:hypothetical protein